MHWIKHGRSGCWIWLVLMHRKGITKGEIVCLN